MNALLGLTTLPILLSAGEGSGFEAPTLEHEFDPAPFLFAGTPFEMNRIIMVRMIAALVLAAILIIYAKRARLVPTRGQNLVEFLLNFSKENIAEELLGADAKRFQPLIMTIFLGVLFMNITGVFPGLQIAGTSLIGMPLIYALVAYVGFIAAGIKAMGGRFFKEQLMPPGVPWPMYILMIPLEFFSTFILRPVTLTVRLLANMVAGHFILVLCFVGTHYLYLQMGGAAGLGLGTLTLLGGIVFVIFELFIGALQAYIFAMLAASYISLSISEH
ncbi:MAG: F0F1 ATP synthase subunit A [Actinomycetaceae bacterium]|nr:F0F1 ATP synthase subunit A [Arcanobacterium sp.]MDD7504975.1 F0F1 ATP synthase subunit A [Actinomycetaceae bacterium]MDY6143368.1 F0F1 ATP synthase subunit A [Arcanobacterium sp.]